MLAQDTVSADDCLELHISEHGFHTVLQVDHDQWQRFALIFAWFMVV